MTRISQQECRGILEFVLFVQKKRIIYEDFEKKRKKDEIFKTTFL